jgi:plastocyanin
VTSYFVRMSCFIGALGMIVSTMGLSAPSQPHTHTVTIEGMQFRPEALNVSSGDTIVWVNNDLVPHTATSETGGFVSKEIQAGKSWRYVIQQKGEFAYTCTFHPAMKAMLHVR